MSDFKSKMHQIRFWLGLCPRPHSGAYSAPPQPWLDLGALLLRGGGSEGEEEGSEGKGREGA